MSSLDHNNPPYKVRPFVPYGRQFSAGCCKSELWQIFSEGEERCDAWVDIRESLENELYWTDRLVVWSKGYENSSRVTVFKHEFPVSGVIKAVLVEHNPSLIEPRSPSHRLLFVLRRYTHIDVFDEESGETHSLLTPFPIGNAFAIPKYGGIMLERRTDAENDQTSMPDEHSDYRNSHLVTLSQPMDQFHPIVTNNRPFRLVSLFHHHESDRVFVLAHDERLNTLYELQPKTLTDTTHFPSLEHKRQYICSSQPVFELNKFWKQRRSSGPATKAIFVNELTISYLCFLAADTLKIVAFKSVNQTLKSISSKNSYVQSVKDIAHIPDLNAIAVLRVYEEGSGVENICIQWPSGSSLCTVSCPIGECSNGYISTTRLHGSGGLSFFLESDSYLIRCRMDPIATNRTVHKCIQSLSKCLNEDNFRKLYHQFYNTRSHNEFEHLHSVIFPEVSRKRRPRSLPRIDENDLDDDDRENNKYWKLMTSRSKAHSVFVEQHRVLDKYLGVIEEDVMPVKKSVKVKRSISPHLLDVASVFWRFSLICEEVSLIELRSEDHARLLPMMLSFARYLNLDFMIDYYVDLMAGLSLTSEITTFIDSNPPRPLVIEYRLLPWLTTVVLNRKPALQFKYDPPDHPLIDQLFYMYASLYPTERVLTEFENAGLVLDPIFALPPDIKPQIRLLHLIRPEFVLSLNPILNIGVHESLAWLSESWGCNKGDSLINHKVLEFTGRFDVVRFLSFAKEIPPGPPPLHALASCDEVGGSVSADDADESAYLMTSHARDVWPNDLRIREIRRLLDIRTENTNANLLVFVGRGMFTLYTLEHQGRINVTNVRSSESDQHEWPRFHHGTACALAVFPSYIADPCSQHAMFRANFMLGNGSVPRMTDMDAERCGLLYGLGLAGLFSKVSSNVIFNLLVLANGGRSREKPKELLTLSILLAYSASLHHSSDSSCTRTLLLHIRACVGDLNDEQRGLEPMVQIQPMCQMAAIIGLGLVHARSGNERASEILCREIGNWPLLRTDSGHTLIESQAAHSLTAGIGLGLVNLAKGSKTNPNIIEALVNFCTKCDSIQEPAWSIGHQVSMGHKSNRCLLTTPAASLALGLIFFGTGDDNFANQILKLNTRMNPRPDLFFYRLLAYWLIRINIRNRSCQLTSNCLFVCVCGETQIPSFTIRFYDEEKKPRPDEAFYWDAVDRIASTVVFPVHRETALAFVMGIRFAGSRQWPLASFFLKKAQQKLAGNSNERLKLVLLVSASLIMAGTGCLPIIRLLRSLQRSAGNKSCASTLAVNMALGFCVLGAGRLSFKQDNFSRVCLLASTLPIFPKDVKDNQSYPQFMRQFYVLAVESRLLRFRSGLHESIHCDVDVELNSSKNCISWKRVTSCHLPILETISCIRIKSTNHWPVTIRLPEQINELRSVLGGPPAHLGSLSYYTLEPRNGGKARIFTGKMSLSPAIQTALELATHNNPNNLNCTIMHIFRLLLIYVRSRPKSLAFDYTEILRYERLFEENLMNYKNNKHPQEIKRHALSRAYYLGLPSLLKVEDEEEEDEEGMNNDDRKNYD